MKFLCSFAVIAVFLAFFHNVHSVEETVAVASVVDEVPVVAEPATLVEMDAGVKDAEGDLNRETRQFGFGRPGGFYRPRPFYGGGFYGPRPYYGGGGFYRPRPYYGGGFYGPRPYYGGFFG